MANPEQVMVGGLPIAVTSRDGLADLMVRDCRANAAKQAAALPSLVFSANGQSISMNSSDGGFRELMARADIIHADGMSIVLAARLLTRRGLPERVATTDFFHDAARRAAAHGLSFYLLGGTESSNAAAFRRVRALYPELRLIGRHHGYFTADEEPDLVRDIARLRPDVLWVGLGRPRQELFCVRHREALRGVGWLKTCGGLYNFLAGEKPRAPGWMQSLGLEWLHRVIVDPRRLFWRYTTTNVHAMALLLIRTRDLAST